MSFILKALKKIENDAAKKDLSRLNPQKTDLFKAIEHQIHRNRYANKRNVILFTVFFIIAGSGIFLKLKPWKNNTVENTMLPATTLEANKNQLPPPNIPQKKPDTTPALLPETVTASVNHAPVSPQKPPMPRTNPSPPVKHQTDSVTYAYGIESAGGKSLSASEKHHKKNNNEDIQLKREQDTGLKLQAIAWAYDPEKRLTVINGKIIHEGEYIDDAAVVQIDKNQIVFKKKGETWRQMFRTNLN